MDVCVRNTKTERPVLSRTGCCNKEVPSGLQEAVLIGSLFRRRIFFRERGLYQSSIDYQSMERHSVNRRRSLNLGSPTARSRSAERSMRQFDETLAVQVETKVCESPSSDAKRSRNYRVRSMSDPFDTADAGIIDEDVRDYGTVEDDEHSMPTLPRYPFAETNNKNCWSDSPINIFSVRGEKYLTKKKKVAAGEYLLCARGCDLFLSEKPNACDMSKLDGALGGNLRHVPSLLIRLTFPWGLLIQYYEVPTQLLPFMRGDKSASMDDLTRPEITLAKWLLGDDKYKTDRLKLIPNVAEGPWIVRNLVAGKPSIIGKKVPITYNYVPKEGWRQDFLECNLDIGNSTKTAQKIVSVCRRYMTALTVDIGFVIEGKTPDELPEEMMGAIRIHHVDSIYAPTIH